MEKELHSLKGSGSDAAGQEARKRVLEFQLDEQKGPKRGRKEVPSGGLSEAPSVGQTSALCPPAELAAKRPLQREYAAGHLLFRTGDLLWCGSCGAYAEKRVLKLGRCCPRVALGIAAHRLALLHSGRHPQTYVQLGAAAIRVADEEA